MTTEITDPKSTLAEPASGWWRRAVSSISTPRSESWASSGSGLQHRPWDDQNEARIVSQRLARYEGLFDMVESLTSKIDDAEVLLELADEAGDDVARKEALEELSEVAGELDALELESLYFDEYDEADAILSVHAGAGGVDAQDWAEMMARIISVFSPTPDSPTRSRR